MIYRVHNITNSDRYSKTSIWYDGQKRMVDFEMLMEDYPVSVKAVILNPNSFNS